MLLDKIEKANDIKKIDKSDYGELAEEIRQFLIEKISVTGGHLGSNLGAVPVPWHEWVPQEKRKQL